MNILLLGDYYSTNLGDGVICETVRSLIREAYPNSNIVISDLSGRDGFITEDLLVPSDSFISRVQGFFFRIIQNSVFLKNAYLNGGPNKLRHIKRICSGSYDIAVFAGGQLFLDYFCISIARYSDRLSKKNVPVVFNACGTGEIGSRILLAALRRALSHENVASITVRDNVDLVNEYLLQGTGKSAILSSDPALWTRELYGIEKQGGETVGIGVIAPYIGRNQISVGAYTGLIDELNARKISWELFCNGGHADYSYALEVAELTGYDESKVAKRPETPVDLVRLLAKYRGILSSRLHSHVIAASLGVPSVALLRDNKVRSFFESIRCPDRCFDFSADQREMLQKLLEAEKSGYDETLINNMKRAGRDLLIGNIAGALKRAGA